MNFVGVEIFDSLVLQANALFAAKNTTKNLAYISANINASARTLQFPPSLKMVSIQFPDPWHDPKKANRRVVNDDLAVWLADVLPPGQGEVYICSDVLPLAQEMKSVLINSGAFELHPLHSGSTSSSEWLPTRPYVQPSERDLVCEKEWRAVYRALLVRRALP
jgi:tRNA (guanine-N7-)-methyltransferase